MYTVKILTTLHNKMNPLVMISYILDASVLIINLNRYKQVIENTSKISLYKTNV